MGWLYQARMRGQSNREWFEKEFSSLDFLECGTVRGVFYAAVRPKSNPERPAMCLVCLTQWVPKDRYNFGYKDLDETMGPYAYRCPEKVLKALGPLEPGKYPSAEEWRAINWREVEKRKAARKAMREAA